MVAKSGKSASGKTLNKTAPQKTAGGAAPGKGSESSKKGGSGGLFSGLGAFFGGRNRSNAPVTGAPTRAPTAADRPMARPGILAAGVGEDRTYTDTRTGQTFREPEFRPGSFRGLTSTDPGNVARNRMAAEMYARQAASNRAAQDDRGSRGIASLAPAPTTPGVEPTAPPPMTPAQLAQIGASTSPMAPVEVMSPNYGMSGGQPAINYGAAFQMMPGMMYDPYANMNLMDIFGTMPPFGMRA